MLKRLLLLIYLIFFSFNAQALPGISKLFKSLFSKGDEIIDVTKNVGKEGDKITIRSEEFNQVINPKTYEGQSFESILEDISAINAEPIENIKQYFDPTSNPDSLMTQSDYSLWGEYLIARGGIKYNQSSAQEDGHKIKVCTHFNTVYRFVEFSTNEVLLISINNKLIKKVLPEVYANEQYRQYYYRNGDQSIQFIFYNDRRFIISTDQKIFINGAPTGMLERCDYL